MSGKTLSIISFSIVSIIGIIFLGWWHTLYPYKELMVHIPGMDGRAIFIKPTKEDVVIGKYFKHFEDITYNLPGSWPRFRGSYFDNRSREGAVIRSKWENINPEILWSVELGEGHAGPAVHRGRVYLLDYDESKRSDVLRCLSLKNGREIWRRWYSVKLKRNHGMSRTVPAVTDEYVVTIGPKCHIMCVDALSGDFKWGVDLEKEYSTEVPMWYTAQCPLIDNSIAVIAPGGTALMIGVDCKTGEVLWETPNPDKWKMSHSSIMPMVLEGKKMYVYCALGGIFGVAAEGSDRGKMLWKSSEWNNAVIVPSPVIFSDGRIFVTAGYGAGSMMLKVDKIRENFTVKIINSWSPKESLACEQQTPILYNGYLYGILPKDAGPNRMQFVCYNPDGGLVWASGKMNLFGLGPFILADDKFFILKDDGVLTVAEASSNAYKPFVSYKLLDGRDAWAPLAIAGRRLLLRDSKKLVCIDVGIRGE